MDGRYGLIGALTLTRICQQLADAERERLARHAVSRAEPHWHRALRVTMRRRIHALATYRWRRPGPLTVTVHRRVRPAA